MKSEKYPIYQVIKSSPNVESCAYVRLTYVDKEKRRCSRYIAECDAAFENNFANAKLIAKWFNERIRPKQKIYRFAETLGWH